MPYLGVQFIACLLSVIHMSNIWLALVLAYGFIYELIVGKHYFSNCSPVVSHVLELNSLQTLSRI